ncbi:hypothetical protein EC988_009093, partial [Linderina pennispora]
MFTKTALTTSLLAALAASQQVDYNSISQNWNEVVAHASAALPLIQQQPALLAQYQSILGGANTLPANYDPALVSLIENQLPTQVGFAILGVSQNNQGAVPTAPNAEQTAASVPVGTVVTGPEPTDANTVPTAPQETAPNDTAATPSGPEATGATAPSGTDATAPSATDATAPSATDATAPSATDATAPSGTDATAPSATDATVPSGTDATVPSGTDATPS